MNIPFLGGTYNGRSVNIDASRSVNFYPELTGTQDNKTQISLVGTPGLNLFTLGIGGGNSPVRGIYTFNGVMYAVIGNTLFTVNSGGIGTSRGTLATSSGRVQFANNGTLANGVGGDQLMIVDGTHGYIYNQTSTVFSTIAVAGGWPDAPKQVAFIDGYFVATNGSMAYWVSNLYDGLTWGALATASVAATPDSIQTVVNFNQQLFFIKQWSTEIWYDAGVATTSGSPFARVSGAVYPFGTSAPWSIAKGGSNFYFLCTQRTEEGGETVGVAQISGNAPTIISPPAINYRISTSTTYVNCFGYCYVEQGHVFYVLTNPDDNWTLVYDATTQMWHERSSLMNDYVTVNRHLGNCYTFFNGKHYVGDYRNSSIYEMSSVYTTDNGNPIYSFRTAQTIQEPNMHKYTFISNLVVDAETGVGGGGTVITAAPNHVAGWNGSVNVLILADGSITAGAMLSGSADPTADLSWSDDAGHTWSALYPKSLTVADLAGYLLLDDGSRILLDDGSKITYTCIVVDSYSTRLSWRRLGKARDRVFKIGISAGVKKVLIGAYVEAGI